MNDLRECKAVVLEALKDLRKKDAENRCDGKSWGWSLKSIGKSKLVLKWGYIPNIDISIRLEVDEEDENDVTLIGRMDDRYATDYINDDEGDYLFVWIGNKHWHDASSIGDGLKKIIANIGYITRTRY